MRAFLVAVLSVIAVGVLLIAYGLLSPRTAAGADFSAYPAARPMPAGERFAVVDDGNGFVRLAPAPYPNAQTLAYPVSDVRAVSYEPAPAPRFVSTRQTTRSVPVRTRVK